MPLNQIPQKLLSLLIKSLQFLSMALRLPIVILLLTYCVLFQQYIAPLFSVLPKHVHRFISSIVNLICIRLALLLLGITSIDHDGFSYFRKRRHDNTGININRHLIFRSGSVGVGIKRNFVDFLYYACMFNPIFCTLLQYYEDDSEKTKRKLYYVPLTFKQAFFAALKPHGFDPIVAKGKHELRKIKTRKMQLKTLLAESQRDLLGPILTFMTQASPNSFLDVPVQIYQGMMTNYQGGYQRQGIAFSPQLYNLANNSKQSLSSQSQFAYLAKLCSEFSLLTLRINLERVQGARHARHFGFNRFMPRQNINTSSPQNQNVLNKFFKKQGYKTVSKTWRQYSEYIDQNKMQQERVNRKKGHGKNKNKKMKHTRSVKHQQSNSAQWKQLNQQNVKESRRKFRRHQERPKLINLV